MWGATGHRPKKLGGYAPEIAARLEAVAASALQFYGVDEIAVGMALGWDTAVAKAAYALGIPYHAVIPFVGQEEQWPRHSRDIYHGLLASARSVTVITVNQTTWGSSFQGRNIELVRRSIDGAMLALWDGDLATLKGEPGGTLNCLRYAQQVGRPCINLWSKYHAMR